MSLFSWRKMGTNGLKISVLCLLTLTLPIQMLKAENAVPVLPEEKEAPLSDAKITAFAKAQIAMHRIFMKYQPEMEKPAKTDQEKMDLQQKIIGEMSQALEAQGITQEEYNSITKKAGQDQELYKRLSKEMVAVQKSSAPSAPAPEKKQDKK